MNLTKKQEAELYIRLHSTCVYGIVHQKPISVEIDDILNEAKAEYALIEDYRYHQLGDYTSQEEAKDAWFKKWFGAI